MTDPTALKGVDVASEARDYGSVVDPNDPNGSVGSLAWRCDVEGPYRRLDANPGKLELVRLALCVLTIVPIRLVLIVLSISLYGILAWCWLAVTPNRPWSHSVSIFLVRKATRWLLLLMGFWKVEVKGRENSGLQTEPRVFVANHISYVEILFFLADMGPSFVMKRTCLQVPVIGRIATRILDSVSVDNKGGKKGGSGSEAIASRLELMFGEKTLADWRANVTKEWDDRKHNSFSSQETSLVGTTGVDAADGWARGWRGNPLLLFPEGTTSNGSCLLRFKTGVFAGSMPVYPIAVRYNYRRFSPAFESIPFSVHLIRMLAEPSNHLSVEFLPRYSPKPEERNDRQAYAKAVQGIFCDALGLPAVETGYAQKTKFHKYLRHCFKEHPWGSAAFILPAPDRHAGVTHVEWDDVDTPFKRYQVDSTNCGTVTDDGGPEVTDGARRSEDRNVDHGEAERLRRRGKADPLGK